MAESYPSSEFLLPRNGSEYWESAAEFFVAVSTRLSEIIFWQELHSDIVAVETGTMPMAGAVRRQPYAWYKLTDSQTAQASYGGKVYDFIVPTTEVGDVDSALMILEGRAPDEKSKMVGRFAIVGVLTAKAGRAYMVTDQTIIPYRSKWYRPDSHQRSFRSNRSRVRFLEQITHDLRPDSGWTHLTKH